MPSRLPRLVLEMRNAIFTAVYEYLIIVAPVAIYVALESVHSGGLKYFALSPEWSIASLFLSFQGVNLYRRDLGIGGKPLSEEFLGVLGLIALLAIVASTIIAYLALTHDTTVLQIARLLILLATSLAFLLFVGAGRLAAIRNGRAARAAH
jgi:hypothetical protein